MLNGIMNAFFCVITQKDSVLIRERTEAWADMNVKFTRSREKEFCENLNNAYEDGDSKTLATVFTKWERFHKMPGWQVTCVKVLFDEVKPSEKAAVASTEKNVTTVPSPAVPVIPAQQKETETTRSDKNDETRNAVDAQWPSEDDDDEDDSSLL